jgi:hypothetical protein
MYMVLTNPKKMRSGCSCCFAQQISLDGSEEEEEAGPSTKKAAVGDKKPKV